MKPGIKPKVSPLAKKQDAKGRSADGSSTANGEQRVWKAGPRPPGAAPWQDSNFTLEDDALSSSLEALFSCFCCWDPALPGCPIVSASPGFEALTGYSPSDYLGRTSSSKLLQGPKTEPEAVAALSAGVDAGAFTSVEITLHRQDGRPFRSLVCLVPLVDGDGGVAVWCEVHCDLEEKRKGSDEAFLARWAEQVKNHSSNYLLLDAASEEGSVTGVGAGLTHLTGYTTSHLAGCSCLCLAGPTTSASSMRKLMGCLGGSQKQAATTMLLHKRDGSAFWAHVVACPLGLSREQQQVLLGYNYHQPASQFYGSSGSAAAAAAAAGGGGGGQGAGGSGLKAPQVLVLVLDVTQQRPKRLGKYLMGKVLGQGASGLVRMGKNTTNDELVAVKSVDASRFRSLDEIQQVQEEMAVLSQLKHPNIIRLQEVHFSGNVFFFIMDWASGGSLVQYIYSHEGHALPEKEAHRIFSQLLSGLEYCHKRRVIHRDLKPENILMEGGNPKIADFGLAGVMAPFNAGGFTLQCGTPEFTAPEIVEGKEYEGPAVDLWSVGVMLYEALVGELPFKGSSQSALFAAIKKGVYPALPAHISAEGKDLVKRLLTTDPALRITWTELNRHPWLGGPGSSSSGSATNTSSSSNIAQAGPVSGAGTPNHACSSGGGVDVANGEGSRSGRGSEGGSDEQLPVQEISDAAALSESSELSGSVTLDDGEGPEGCADAEPGSSSGLNSSIRSNKGEGGDGGSTWGEMPDLLRGGRGGGGAGAGGGLSFTSNRCHDSVRVVIPGGTVDKDDPILAAIMRTAESFSAGISPASASTRSHILEEYGASNGSGPVSPRSASFSVGSASPGTPGMRGGLGGGSGAAGSSGLGGRGPLGPVAKNLAGSPGGGPRGLRANSSSNLPPLSPTSATDAGGSSSAAAAAAAAVRKVASGSGQAAGGGLGGSRAGPGALSSSKPTSSLNSSLERGAGLSKEPLKSYAAGMGSGAQQKGGGGGGGGGSGQASPTSMLPPIGRDRGTPGRSLRS